MAVPAGRGVLSRTPQETGLHRKRPFSHRLVAISNPLISAPSGGHRGVGGSLCVLNGSEGVYTGKYGAGGGISTPGPSHVLLIIRVRCCIGHILKIFRAIRCCAELSAAVYSHRAVRAAPPRASRQPCGRGGGSPEDPSMRAVRGRGGDRARETRATTAVAAWRGMQNRRATGRERGGFARRRNCSAGRDPTPTTAARTAGQQRPRDAPQEQGGEPPGKPARPAGAASSASTAACEEQRWPGPQRRPRRQPRQR